MGPRVLRLTDDVQPCDDTMLLSSFLSLTNRNSEEPGARAGRGPGPGTEGQTEGTGPERTVHISKKRLYRESILHVPNGSATTSITNAISFPRRFSRILASWTTTASLKADRHGKSYFAPMALSYGFMAGVVISATILFIVSNVKLTASYQVRALRNYLLLPTITSNTPSTLGLSRLQQCITRGGGFLHLSFSPTDMVMGLRSLLHV